MSLDGYLAGPNGEADWIVMDPAIDFAGMRARFDTVLMGRRTFEAAQAQGAAHRCQGSPRSWSRGRSGRRTIRPRKPPGGRGTLAGWGMAPRTTLSAKIVTRPGRSGGLGPG